MSAELASGNRATRVPNRTRRVLAGAALAVTPDRPTPVAAPPAPHVPTPAPHVPTPAARPPARPHLPRPTVPWSTPDDGAPGRPGGPGGPRPAGPGRPGGARPARPGATSPNGPAAATGGAGSIGVVGADRLGPTSAELARLHRVAAGEDEADLLVHGGTLAVVHTGELLRRDVAIVGRFIAAVTRPGALAGRRSLDASGRFLLPAFVDGHLRPERSLLTPGEIARLLVPRGTATVLTDPTGFVARLGVRGGDLATGTGTPLRMLARRPASIATAGPPPGEFLPADTATSTRSFADLIGTGQLGCAVHAATVAGIAPLDALRRATLAPARRHGLDHVLGSITPSHLADLLIVSELGGAGPPDLVVVGGRIAAARGESLFDNLDAVPRWCMDTVRLPVSLALPSFVLPDWPGHPAPLPAAVEVLPRSAAAHPEGQLRDRQPDGGRGAGGLAATLASRGLAVRHVRMEPMARDGHMVADPARDVTKVAVVDRSGRTAAPRVGLVCGVGLASGAIGVTTSAAPGDLLLVGTNDADMLTAARALEGMGGGFVVVDRGWVQAACPLPIAGIVSDAPWEAVEGQLAAADAVAVALGCRWSAPLLTLAALGAELYTHP